MYGSMRVAEVVRQEDFPDAGVPELDVVIEMIVSQS
jgi:hypothetical protein